PLRGRFALESRRLRAHREDARPGPDLAAARHGDGEDGLVAQQRPSPKRPAASAHKPSWKTARGMATVMKLFPQYFELARASAFTCFTCHQGAVKVPR